MSQIHDLLIKDNSVLQSAYCKYRNEVCAPSVSTEWRVLKLQMEETVFGYSNRCKYNEQEIVASRKRVVFQLKLNILNNRMLRNLSQNLGLGRILW
jgi:hypothetical protein